MHGSAREDVMEMAGRPGSRERASATGRIARIVGVIAAFGLSGVLLFSVWAKGLDSAGFAEQMVRDKMVPTGFGMVAAVIVVGLEAAIAFGLIGARSRIIVLAGTLMMGGFLGLSVWQYYNPPEDPSSCGCFGNLVLQSPGQHIFVNSLFFVLALLAWMAVDRGWRMPAWRWSIPAIGFLLGAALSVAAPKLPVDNLATQARPGVEVAKLRIDEILPELQAGRQLVLLIDRGDEQTRLDVARVNELVALEPTSEVDVFGLAEENEELEIEFLWTAAPAFEVRGAPWGVLKPLYRTLPRTFLVEDGTIVAAWNEIPDEETLIEIAGGKTP